MVELTLEINALKSSLFWTVINRGIVRNLLYRKRHITESDNGYVPYCFLQCCFFTVHE